ncbi:GTP 3',8-cyclase MoaA [Pedobacter sp. P351]|uniref:GTP 3',8-cyclase MoaA n=1 Tax=Pedobacter superstes TaxID=3133441 RepID=UPI0030A84FDB
MAEIIDSYGRTFKTLRVSLINTCNLGCVYCTFGNDEQKENYKSSKEKSLSPAELGHLIKQLHEVLNLDTIRFTGGEPLLYKELPELVKSVKNSGIDDLKITTNGLLLENMARRLKDAGITELNVSLDAFDEDVFYKMSRRSGINRTFNGIDSAIKAGIKVKINSVIMKGLNESQIIPLLNFAADKGITIRFLEIMAMGHLYGSSDQHFFSQEEILDTINQHYNFKRLSRQHSSTANYWQTDEGHTFGIVANESEPFCSDCNRLRLDSYGNIYGCLSSNHPISIKNIDNNELVLRLEQALKQKQSLRFAGSELSMMHIGG